MKRYFILMFLPVILLLCSCNSTPDMYEYATTVLVEPELLLAADGTVWRRGEPNENGFVDDVEIVDSLEAGTINTEVREKNANNMELWEYTLLTMDNKLDYFEAMTAVGGDGSTWVISRKNSTSYNARRCDPEGEIDEEQIIDGFWLKIAGVETTDHPHASPQVIRVVLHDDNGALINPGFAILEVLIDGQWYMTNTSYSGTLETKFFDKNGEYHRSTPLCAGYNKDIPLPSGHYRLKADADDYTELQKYFDEKRGKEYLDLMKRYALLEFDLTYKNGKYKISNIK